MYTRKSGRNVPVESALIHIRLTESEFDRLCTLRIVKDKEYVQASKAEAWISQMFNVTGEELKAARRKESSEQDMM